jgi:hypothetical protein
MVKLLMAAKDSSKGEKYCWRADRISHADGTEAGVNSENVKWYVGAYLRALVDWRSSSAAVSGDNDLVLAG